MQELLMVMENFAKVSRLLKTTKKENTLANL